MKNGAIAAAPKPSLEPRCSWKTAARRHQQRLPSALAETAGEILLLAVQEEALVEALDRSQRQRRGREGTPPPRSRRRREPRLGCGRRVSSSAAPGPAARRKEAGDVRGDPGEPAPAGVLAERSPGDRSRRGIRERRRESLERGARRPHVWVAEQHELGAASSRRPALQPAPNPLLAPVSSTSKPAALACSTVSSTDRLSTASIRCGARDPPTAHLPRPRGVARCCGSRPQL